MFIIVITLIIHEIIGIRCSCSSLASSRKETEAIFQDDVQFQSRIASRIEEKKTTSAALLFIRDKQFPLASDIATVRCFRSRFRYWEGLAVRKQVPGATKQGLFLPLINQPSIRIWWLLIHYKDSGHTERTLRFMNFLRNPRTRNPDCFFQVFWSHIRLEPIFFMLNTNSKKLEAEPTNIMSSLHLLNASSVNLVERVEKTTRKVSSTFWNMCFRVCGERLLFLKQRKLSWTWLV